MKNSGTFKVTTPSDQEIVVTRVFDAPRQLVFDAFTKPEFIKRWLTGPPGWTFPVCEMDAKLGGAYRYVWRGPDGTEMGMRGVIRQITPPERIVASEVFDEAWYPGEAIDTTVFSEQGGKTTLTLTIRYQSREARDRALKSGMDQGMAAGYDRLEALLPTFQVSDQ
ncbi:MAG: SRPBCC family protein [Gemmatimonadaceae bacterium]